MQATPTIWPMIGAVAAVVYPGLTIVGLLLANYVRGMMTALELKITGDKGPIDELKTRVAQIEGELVQPITVRKLKDIAALAKREA